MLDIISRPVYPKEHGAWMVILAPLLAGSLAIGPEDGPDYGGLMSLAVATFFGFLAFTPLRRLTKSGGSVNRRRYVFWLTAYSLVAGAAFLCLLLCYDRMGLVWFVIPAGLLSLSYLWSNAARIHRSLLVELTGIAGLAISAPAGAYVQSGDVSMEALALYLMLVIWFTDRMMMARKTLETIRSSKELPTIADRVLFFRNELALNGLAIGSVAGLIYISGAVAPWTALAPFGLGALKNWAVVITGSTVDDPMKVGFSEMRIGLAFTALMITAWRIA